MQKKFFKVYDVLLECEDTDHVRIIYNGRIVTSGSWYMDNILSMGEKSVAKVDYDNTSISGFDIWNIYLK